MKIFVFKANEKRAISKKYIYITHLLALTMNSDNENDVKYHSNYVLLVNSVSSTKGILNSRCFRSFSLKTSETTTDIPTSCFTCIPRDKLNNCFLQILSKLISDYN